MFSEPFSELVMAAEVAVEAGHGAATPRLVLSEHSVDFIAGLFGGCAGLAFGHPFDTIKVRQQTGGQASNSMIKAIRTTLVNDGVRGFFRGMAFPLASVGFLNSIFFGVYGNTIRSLSEKYSPDPNADPAYRHIFIAGAFAGAVQAIPACPIELVKVNLQAQTGVKFKGPVDCLNHIYRQQGVRGCFKGLGATISREVPGFSIYITSYQYLCDQMTPEGQIQPSVRVMLLAGGLAGMGSWMVNIPVDIVKSRLQADDFSNPKYRGMLDCAVKSYKAEGWKIFWRGLPVTCIRAFPTNAVTFAVYSTSLTYLQQHTHRKTRLFD